MPESPATHTASERVQKDLVSAVLAFCRKLTVAGLPVNSEQARQALRALTFVDVLDPEEFYITLRAILVNAPEHTWLFHTVFASFWKWPKDASEHAATASVSETLANAAAPQQVIKWPSTKKTSAVDGTRDLSQRNISDGDRDEGSRNPLTSHSTLAPEPSPENRLYSSKVVETGASFSEWSASTGQAVVGRVVSRIVRRLSLRPSRRYESTPHGGRWDPRRTMRASLRFGGVPVSLARRRRKLQKPRIVLICDVSRSMEPYSVFVLQVIYSFQGERGRIESFVFSTGLQRVTPYLRRWPLKEAVERISRDFPYWSGGTRIGESVCTFNVNYGRALVDRRAVVVVVSDGLDTGEPELVSHAMEGLTRRAGAIVWLNPLLGTRGYQPRAKGMAAALPFIDVMAPIRDMGTLESLADLLSSNRIRAFAR